VAFPEVLSVTPGRQTRKVGTLEPGRGLNGRFYPAAWRSAGSVVAQLGNEHMDDASSHGGERRGGPPSEDRVRLELVLFADLIRRLESEGRLADALPFVLRRLGDLRQLLFDYEVRATERLLPIEDPNEREARRVIREVEERAREMRDEWREPWTPDGEEGPES
jgi:hypothetical protein